MGSSVRGAAGLPSFRLTPSISAFDGVEMRLPAPGDEALLEALLTEPSLAAQAAPLAPHGSADELARLSDLDLWGMPMLFEHDRTPIGAIVNTETDLQSLSTRAVPLFADETMLAVALAMYVRHVFWCYPIRRISAHSIDERPAPSELCAAGFQAEGVLRSAHVHDGLRYDLAIFGVLRSEFARVLAPRLRSLAIAGEE